MHAIPFPMTAIPRDARSASWPPLSSSAPFTAQDPAPSPRPFGDSRRSRLIQDCLHHKALTTTKAYAHVVNSGGRSAARRTRGEPTIHETSYADPHKTPYQNTLFRPEVN